MSFKSVYQHALNREGYHSDTAQATVVDSLDRLFVLLQDNTIHGSVDKGLWQRLMSVTRPPEPLHGCYLWGGVGRGKTWLMDLFYHSVPVDQKLRFHFHGFMNRVHDLLGQLKGQKDPLKTVAGHMAQRARLICLDEFHVSDITDAMLLYGFLQALYQHGVVLVMTSNIPPDDLYKNGLQRSRFEPAIELIKQHNSVIQLEGDIDHRLRDDHININYYYPLCADTDSRLLQRFRMLAAGRSESDTIITIHNRPVRSRMVADNIIWFDFETICGGPRAARDYISIAQQFDYVIVSNVFKMDSSYDDMTKRFINLVDEFYDRKVGLVVSATAMPADLYTGRRFCEEFERTRSRLEQMKSVITQPQLPAADWFKNARADG
ncbi:MAG: cell division protein ZapE [Gammaproteobacteria bacterium]|jgi:cell division protein ZapE